MSTDAKESDKPTLSKYTYASSIYFVLAGVLYLWGYWGSFGINVLEFAGLSDIVITTAYPIATTFGFFAVGAVVGELLVDRSPGREATLKGQFWPKVRRHIEPIAMFYIAGVVALFIFGPESKWRVLPVLLALPLYAAAKRQGFLETAVTNEQTRSIFVFLLVSLPLFSYGQGKTKALAITEARSYTYLISSIDGMAIKNSTATEFRLRYLGQVNDYLFFYNPEGKLPSWSALSMRKPSNSPSTRNKMERKPALQYLLGQAQQLLQEALQVQPLGPHHRQVALRPNRPSRGRHKGYALAPPLMSNVTRHQQLYD